MFFILSKLLEFLFTPVLWIFILLLLALILKDKRKKKSFLIGGIILFYLFTNSFLFSEAARVWETGFTSPHTVEKHDAAIVLGGFSTYDAELGRPQFYRTSDRFLAAWDLYNKKKIRKLIISGGSGSLLYPDTREALIIGEFLRESCIPSVDLVLESTSRNTYENAAHTAAILKQENMLSGKLLLVTSGFHMRRAIECFKKAGISCTPYSTDRYAGARRFHPDHLFLPNAEVLMKWNVLIHEWLGYVVYQIMGYI